MKIIWINGAFGAGKTTVVEHLNDAVAGARVFAPEIIGSLMHYLGEESPTGDFQDIELWRRLVADAATGMMDVHDCDLIVPMTLVVDTYIDEIGGRVRAQGHDLRMFWLELPTDELERRIGAQVVIEDDSERDAEVRQWRLDQIDRCQAAASSPSTGEIVANHGRPAAETAADILRRLDHPA